MSCLDQLGKFPPFFFINFFYKFFWQVALPFIFPHLYQMTYFFIIFQAAHAADPCPRDASSGGGTELWAHARPLWVWKHPGAASYLLCHPCALGQNWCSTKRCRAAFNWSNGWTLLMVPIAQLTVKFHHKMVISTWYMCRTLQMYTGWPFCPCFFLHGSLTRDYGRALWYFHFICDGGLLLFSSPLSQLMQCYFNILNIMKNHSSQELGMTLLLS